MKTYQQHLESTLSYGETVSRSRKPIFRSSAIFPVIHLAGISTRILFMGYWLLKRQIPEVQLLVTLRGAGGEALLRKSMIVDSPRAHAVYLEPLLREAGALGDQEFRGSLEFEIYATRDLVFPYPAFVLNYWGPDFVTSVHTAGRIYNDIDDLLENDAYAVPESGFDVLSSDEYEPFVAFVNGPYAYDAPSLEWTVTDEKKRTMQGSVSLGPVRPYQTVYLDLASLFPLRSLLSGRKGTVKLAHQMRGFFPRLIAGNRRKAGDGVSITHSYYDSSSVSDAGAYWTRTDDQLNDSSIFIPVFAEGTQYTDLVFYPIYSPSKVVIDLVFYDTDGNVLAQVDDWMELDTAPDHLQTVRLNDVIMAHVPAELVGQVRGINIRKNWIDRSRIPTRLKFGLNVGTSNGRLDLPTNICFNSELGNAAVLQKPRAFRWCPILNHGQSLLVLTNSSTLKRYDRAANVQLQFFREADAACLERHVTLQPFGQCRIEMATDPELSGFLGNGTGWVTIVADNPVFKAWYFDFTGSGVVAGDHSF